MAYQLGQFVGILLDPKSGDPLYRQLFDQIVGRIRSGTYPAGFRLPPTRSLADELGAHRNTVVRAYEDLEAAGFVHSNVGRGTFVAQSVPAVTTTVAPASQPRGLPWEQLVSNAVGVEPLARADRLARGNAPLGAIALNKMQPSTDLLPEDLLRRCLDHVMRTQGAKAMGYAPRDGLPRLRELVAADLVRQGVPASADDLIITTGSQQGLDMLARAMINPGDAMLVDDATYPGALNLFACAGARLVGVPNDGDGPDLAVLAREGRPGVKGLYVMPNCQNPTGARISSARREALVAWSHQAGIPIIEDDFASDLHLDGQTPLPAMRALDGEVVYIGTYSKKLIPALRIGYVLCPRALRPHLFALKSAMDLGNSALLQHALAEFLERGYLRPHLGKVVAEYRARRDALDEALRVHLPSSVTWKRPESGVMLWLEVPAEVDLDALYQEAQRQGVLTSPSSVNTVRPGARRGLRLTFCAEPPERLVEGARRLGRAFTQVLKPNRRAVAAPSVMEVV